MVAQENAESLEAACNELYGLYEEEALYASLKTDIEGLICFWLLIINIFLNQTARISRWRRHMSQKLKVPI